MSETRVVAILVLAILALCTVLGFVGCNPKVECWYTAYAQNSYAAPSFQVRGRTLGALSTDVQGPIFQTKAELDSYITDHHLHMCGTK